MYCTTWRKVINVKHAYAPITEHKSSFPINWIIWEIWWKLYYEKYIKRWTGRVKTDNEQWIKWFRCFSFLIYLSHHTAKRKLIHKHKQHVIRNNFERKKKHNNIKTKKYRAWLLSCVLLHLFVFALKMVKEMIKKVKIKKILGLSDIWYKKVMIDFRFQTTRCIHNSNVMAYGCLFYFFQISNCYCFVFVHCF